MKLKRPLQRRLTKKKTDLSLGKGRKTAGGKDLPIAPILIPALAGDAPVQGLTLLVEGRVPEGECLLVAEAHLDVGPPAPDTDIDVPLCAGGALVLLHHLAAVLLVPARLKKQ